MPTKEFPIRIQFNPSEKQSCVFSNSNLFCQKSFFAWNHKLLQILVDTEKTRETNINVWYFTDTLLQAVRGILNSLTYTTQFYDSFNKKNRETFLCLCSIACKKEEKDWTLIMFSFKDKNLLNLSLILTLQFFEGQSRQEAGTTLNTESRTKR